MRRGVTASGLRPALAALCALTLPLAGGAQDPSARLHRNLPSSYPFDALPAGVVRAPLDPAALARASGGAFSEAQRPHDDVLRPRDAWSSATRSLDADTRSPAGTRLSYRAVFSPSVSPFKRTQSFDAVDAQGRLFVRDPVLQPLRVGESPRATPTQRFTGDVYIELSSGAPTPIPSVAAVSYVVGYRTTPEVQVAFFQDSAGNLFVRGERIATVRLTYVLEAPEAMFVPRAVPAVPTAEVAQRLAVRAPVVPPFLHSDLGPVLAHYALGTREDLATVLQRLTARFRAFRDADLPAAPSASLYRALATGGVGACRHRAYAFALTLMGLGVPARFVGNEAHAWVEVQLPEQGWTRIDLGGWDVPLQARSAQPVQPWVPQAPDPFPRPTEYANGYSTHAARAPGERPGERARPEAPPSPPDPRSPDDAAPGSPGAAPGAAGAPASSAPGGVGAGASQTPGGPQRAGTSRGAELVGAGAALGAIRPELRATSGGDAEPPRRTRTALRLHSVTSVGRAGEQQGFVRGTLVRCEGEATDDEQQPVANLAVQVELLRDGHPIAVERGGHRSLTLGSTTTRSDGHFDAQVLLPGELGAGSYELRVRTPGDATHLPARSD